MNDQAYPKVHVIVLNWNGKDVIEQCLSSLKRVDYPNYEILVVDNNSSDDSVNFLKDNFSDINLLCLEKNLKYAGGNNAAVDFLRFDEDDFFIFINNDTIVSRDFINHLIDPFLENSDCIISVPKILFSRDTNMVWYAGGVIDLWKGIINHIGIRDFDSPKYSFPMETMYATGCCMCIKASDFEQFNRFDESFSIYCEDVDLSIRTRVGNNKILYAPKSVILHRISHSLGENSFQKIKMKLFSQMKLFWKHASGLQLFTITFYWIFFYLPGGLLKWIYFKLR